MTESERRGGGITPTKRRNPIDKPSMVTYFALSGSFSEFIGWQGILVGKA
jgi:hypothetical protein